MVKFALISKHLVLVEYRVPVIGVILIVDEFIEEIRLFDCLITSEFISMLYPDYNILDFTDLYISPGIIDLNTRRE